ncbi:MAG TPA: 4Fe-4S binding protein [Acidobacteria bacterium]|nr:4Fe-4S binding protein [Acidobacteriota bacterium]
MKTINRLFRLQFFPLVLQVVSLGAFVLLVAGGLVADTSEMGFAKVLRNTNLANLLVWSYWWPLIILSAIFLGRVWCTICPMELLTSLASRIGLRRRPPAWLRSGWAMTALYVAILFVGIHTLAIHRVPRRMALYLMGLAGIALLSGLLFARNAFCAHLCPVGHLLGLYARFAPFGWAVRRRDLCSTCKDRSCISGERAYDFQGRSCGVGLHPARIDRNDDCILCGQCLKACEQGGAGITDRPNPGWFRRRWFADVLEPKPLSAAQAAFAFVVSGFVVYELLTEWNVSAAMLLWLPLKVEAIVGVGTVWGRGLLKSTLLFIGLPALFWSLPYLAFRLVGGKLALQDYVLRFGAAFLPLMAGAHATKAVIKMTSRLPYWRLALVDPVGLGTAQALLSRTRVLAPLPLWRDPLVTAVGLVFMGGGVVLSAMTVRRLAGQWVAGFGRRRASLYLIPALLGGVLFGMLISWRVW